MKKTQLSESGMVSYRRKAQVQSINLKEVTVDEKAALETHFKGTLHKGYYTGFEVTTPRRTYAISKLYTGVFSVKVFERSNKKDTSRPIATYCLV